MTKRSLLYLFDYADWHSRIPLAHAAHQDGYDVTIAVLGLPAEDEGDLDGMCLLALPKPSLGRNALGILGFVHSIRALVKDLRPDFVHTVTLKYTFFVGLACYGLRHSTRVYTLAGLGFLFRSAGFKPAGLRQLIRPALRSILRSKKARVIFQNPDDRSLMLRGGYVRQTNSRVILGSGVDLERFVASHVPAYEHGARPLVLMPTRLVREKGIEVFVQAAQTLKAGGMDAKFEIAGGETQHNPKAISAAEMNAMTADGSAKWLGRVQDMPELLSRAHLIVYPSYYGEGIPRVLLEAAATGRPIITTDHPGCREVVEDGVNGFLIPVRDPEATAEAIKQALSDPDKLRQMGEASRSRAETLFDINEVVRQTLSVYEDEA